MYVCIVDAGRMDRPIGWFDHSLHRPIESCIWYDDRFNPLTGPCHAHSSLAAAAAPRAAAAAASVSTDGPLPYDGDRDLNRALQRALAANDTMAMRILFKAQKVG